MFLLLFSIYIILVGLGLFIFHSKLRAILPKLFPKREHALFANAILLAFFGIVALQLGSAFYGWGSDINTSSQAQATTTKNEQQTKPLSPKKIAAEKQTEAQPDKSPVRTIPSVQNPLVQAQPTNHNKTPTNHINVVKKTSLDQFIEQRQPALAEQRGRLVNMLHYSRKFLDQSNLLSKQSPHHRSFLYQVAKNRWSYFDELFKLELKTRNQLILLYSNYQIGNKKHVELELQKLSAQQEQLIKLELSKQVDMQHRETKLVQALNNRVQKLLKQHRPPSTPTLPSYEERNIKTVKTWLAQNEKLIALDYLNELENERQHAIDQLALIKKHQAQYPSIAAKLNKLYNLWLETWAYAIYANYRAMYTLEAAYLLSHPDLQINESRAKQLHKDLLAQFPMILDAIKAKRKKAENSYSASL